MNEISLTKNICPRKKTKLSVRLFLLRIRENPTLFQFIRALPTYNEIPAHIREYLEFVNRGSMAPAAPVFEPQRTLTPTMPLAQQQSISGPHQHLLPRVNSGPAMSGSAPSFTAGKDNVTQKGVGFHFSLQERKEINIDFSYF